MAPSRAERWKRTWEGFHDVLEATPQERASVLDSHCSDDPELRREIEALLEAHETGGGLLDALEDVAEAAGLTRPLLAHRENPPPADLGPGDVLAARFEIVRVLGRGGMGLVCEALDRHLGTRVAVKILGAAAPGGAVAERIRSEVNLARRVTHPNACRVFDLFQHPVDAGSEEEDAPVLPFVTMELLEGETLAQRLGRDGPLELAQVEAVLGQLTDALEAMHAVGVVHGDLKPSNVMLVDAPEGDRAVLTDFGIAAATELASEVDSAPADRALAGSPLYVAPEQLTGGDVGAATDVYALGEVVWEMLVGHPPFLAETAVATARLRLHETAAPPSEHRGDLDPRWDRAVQRALERDPQQRFQRPRELAAALGLRGTEAVEGRRWTPLLLTVVAAIALGLGLAWFAPTDPRPTGPIPILQAAAGNPRLAVLPFAERAVAAHAEADERWLADGVSRGLLEELSRLRRLDVISWAAAKRYRDDDRPPAEIAAEMEVDYLIAGSVRRTANELYVRAEVIDASTATLLATASEQGDLGDVVGVQRRLVRAIAGDVEVLVDEHEEAVLAQRLPASAEAAEAFLQASHHIESGSRREWPLAREHAERAIALQPGFAPAHVVRARACTYIVFNNMEPRDELEKAARESARRAAELAPELAGTHLALGGIAWTFDRDWDAAESGFRRALEIDSGHLPTLTSYASLLSHVGRHDEAVALAKRAMALSPGSTYASFILGRRLAAARRDEEALRQHRLTLELDEDCGSCQRAIVMCLSRLGRHEEARAALREPKGIRNDDGELEAICADEQDPQCRYFSAIVQARAGDPTAAEELLDEGLPGWPGARGKAARGATMAALAGREDETLRWLRTSYGDRSPWLTEQIQDPSMDFLRDHPQFRALECALGLPACELR